MTEFTLGPEVRRLVSSHLASMDHVEVLLLLLKNAPEALTRDEIVSRTGRPEALIDVAVADLTRGGLAASKPGAAGIPAYSYEPQSAELRDAVSELATMYNERPVTLIRAIYDRAPSPVISFADAFRVRGNS